MKVDVTYNSIIKSELAIFDPEVAVNSTDDALIIKVIQLVR